MRWTRCVATLCQVIVAAEADGDRADLGKALLDVAELLLDFRLGEAAEAVVGLYDQAAEPPGFDRADSRGPPGGSRERVSGGH